MANKTTVEIVKAGKMERRVDTMLDRPHAWVTIPFYVKVKNDQLFMEEGTWIELHISSEGMVYFSCYSGFVLDDKHVIVMKALTNHFQKMEKKLEHNTTRYSVQGEHLLGGKVYTMFHKVENFKDRWLVIRDTFHADEMESRRIAIAKEFEIQQPQVTVGA